MSPVLRAWLALTAVGTGLIHVALALGAPMALALVLGAIGFVEFGWGVLTFARERALVPRVALAGALLPVLGWAALALTAPTLAAALGFLPLAVAALFEFAAAVLLARQLRGESTPASPGIARYVVGLLAGVVVVGALTAAALSAAEVLPDAPEIPRHDPH